MEGLRLEWERQSSHLSGKEIASLYFGGGTPSLLFPEYLSEILSWVRPRLAPDCEITIEANPEESSLTLLEFFASLGINRLSLGIQSLDNSSLQELGRIHSAERAKIAIQDAHKAGFKNISIDLMYDLPWQTEASWGRTLKALDDLPITHLSLYNLTIEPHTSFYKRRRELEKAVPPEESSLRMLEAGVMAFENLGLKRYEISAFAKPGCESRHNSGYWTGRPFLGLGPSAFSYWEGKRFSNVSNLQRYRRSLLAGDSPVAFTEELAWPDNLHELLAVRLRLVDGAPKQELPFDTLAKLKKFEAQGLLQESPDRWKLTERGMLFYDSVAEELV